MVCQIKFYVSVGFFFNCTVLSFFFAVVVNPFLKMPKSEKYMNERTKNARAYNTPTNNSSAPVNN